MSTINKRLEKLERRDLPQETITVYLVEDGTRIKAHPETPEEQAIYDQWIAESQARANEITRQDFIKRGIIQQGDDWDPQRGVIRS